MKRAVSIGCIPSLGALLATGCATAQAHYGVTQGATYHDGDADLSDLAKPLSVYGVEC